MARRDETEGDAALRESRCHSDASMIVDLSELQSFDEDAQHSAAAPAEELKSCRPAPEAVPDGSRGGDRKSIKLDIRGLSGHEGPGLQQPVAEQRSTRIPRSPRGPATEAPRKSVALDIRGLRDDEGTGSGVDAAGTTMPSLPPPLRQSVAAAPGAREGQESRGSRSESPVAQAGRSSLTMTPAASSRKSVQLDLRGLRGEDGGAAGRSSGSQAARQDSVDPMHINLEGLQRDEGAVRLDFIYTEQAPVAKQTSTGLVDEHGEVDLRNLKRMTATASSSPGHGSVAAPSGDGRLLPPPEDSQPRVPWVDPQAVAEAPDPETQGPCYSQWIWAYYSNSGAWSDGLCVGLQKLDLCAALVCPPLWFRRLYLTLLRAAPLDVRICSHNFHVTRDVACRAAVSASLFLFVSCIGGTLVSGWLFKTIGGKNTPEARGSCTMQLQAAATFALLPPCCLLGAWLWALLLVSVGQKYNVTQVQRGPLCFLLKACGCLCAMNVRVGLHVDRAQGYEKPSRAVRDMVQMAASMGTAMRTSLVEQTKLRLTMGATGCSSLDYLDMAIQPSDECIKDLDRTQRRTIELGAMSRPLKGPFLA